MDAVWQTYSSSMKAIVDNSRFFEKEIQIVFFRSKYASLCQPQLASNIQFHKARMYHLTIIVFSLPFLADVVNVHLDALAE